MDIDDDVLNQKITAWNPKWADCIVHVRASRERLKGTEHIFYEDVKDLEEAFEIWHAYHQQLAQDGHGQRAEPVAQHTLTFDQKLAQIKARGTRNKAAQTPEEPVQSSLDFWPNEVRGVPNSALRGALFGISQIRKTYRNRTTIAAVDGYEIRFKGETFNQTDLDTLSALLHLAMPHPMGTRVEFSVNSILEALGRGTGKSQHEQFNDEIARLMGGVVEIRLIDGGPAFMGQLISNQFRDEESGRYVIIFNEKMLQLYQEGYTLVNWEQRQGLGKNSLAKWLHGFYSSHAAPFPYKVETLRSLCGTTTERLGDFRKLLRVALEKVKATGTITSWMIDPESDLVTVVKVPSQTQMRHLTKANKVR